LALKFGVMGAGSVGCYVGGRLASTGNQVVFIGRDRLKREIDEHGLSIVDLHGKAVTPARDRFVFDTDVGPLRDCDVVFCCVKSGGTVDAAKRMAEVLRKDAVVVSLQNGVRNPDELRANLGQGVLAGIVNFNVLSKGQGVFRCATSGPLIIERGQDGNAVSEKLGAALVSAGFEVERAARIKEIQWSKLIVNLNNSVVALSDRSISDVIVSPGYRRILAALIGEALTVLRRAGIAPARLGVIPIPLFAAILRLPTPLVRLIARAQLKIDPEARSSMWEDLTTGRPTEVDWLNGEVVRIAESCGVPAPMNRRIVEMVHDAERAAKGSPRLTAEAMWRSLTA
jgi:2-dehydropantoate 2-reductase